MATAKKKKAVVSKVTEPILVCPFMGDQLEIVYSDGTGTYMARGSFWNSKLYKSREALYHDLSHRLGVPPAFSRERPKISVRHLDRPEPNPNADLVVTDVDVDRIMGDM